MKMLEVLASRYDEIRTPIDYFGESKYQVFVLYYFSFYVRDSLEK